MKKYELTNESLIFEDRTLYRIRALRGIPSIRVKAGDLGGWVQSEDNLSHKGDCWIFDNAKAMDRSRVRDNSCMRGNSSMRHNSAMICHSRMYDNSSMNGRAYMSNNSSMHGNSSMWDNSGMRLSSSMHDNSCMKGNSLMTHNAKLIKNGVLSGNACLVNDLFLDRPVEHFMFNGWLCFIAKNKSGELVLKTGCRILPLSKKIIREALIEEGIIDEKAIKLGLDLVQSYVKLFNRIESIGRDNVKIRSVWKKKRSKVLDELTEDAQKLGLDY